jgi:hypothetical protein
MKEIKQAASFYPEKSTQGQKINSSLKSPLGLHR